MANNHSEVVSQNSPVIFSPVPHLLASCSVHAEAMNSTDAMATYQTAALHWFALGFNVIPIVPGSKKTAVKWDAWLDGLSAATIKTYWNARPDHELGHIVGDDMIVFDADSPQSIIMLAELERALELTPSLIVKTHKGLHHYFRRLPGTFAKSDAHSTTEHPDRIDVKTGRAMVILPPSTGKDVELCEIGSSAELTAISQEAIDAIFRHNGRVAPRPAALSVPQVRSLSDQPRQIIVRLKALTDHLDADMGYEDWLHVLMAIYHETDGSEDGFELADAWSRQGKKYPGSVGMCDKWDSFQSSCAAKPVTIATLCKMLQAHGMDWMDICAEAEDPFPSIEPDVQSEIAPNRTRNPLDEYSLKGMSGEIEQNTVAAMPILGQIALLGQTTVIYAAPNTGKTLITLSLLLEAITQKQVDPSQVYYLNMDDTSEGLLDKLRIAEEYGFHMLAEGYQGFTATAFRQLIMSMVENHQAQGIVIILDTLKKFTNLMDKSCASSFTKIIRQFVVKGGTMIALAHTNKNPGTNGKPKYGGTSDIIDDSDCAYTLAIVSHEGSEKVVEFENIKRRGNVVQTAAYSYHAMHSQSYAEILMSVAPMDECQLEPLRRVEAIKADAEVISTIKACIGEGINSKMKLAEATAQRSGVSKASAIRAIEKYTGNDQATHQWQFTTKERGAKVSTLLDQGSEDSTR